MRGVGGPAGPETAGPTVHSDLDERSPDVRKPLRELMLGRNSAGRLYATVGGRRATPYTRLRPCQVRQRRFATTWRGLHPVEVASYLDRVADDLTSLYKELAYVHDENQRIKEALRRWQSSQAPSGWDLARR